MLIFGISWGTTIAIYLETAKGKEQLEILPTWHMHHVYFLWVEMVAILTPFSA